MHGEGTIYRYCSNPLCEYRLVARLELSIDAVYAVSNDEKEAEGACPYCEGPLTQACPECGRTPRDRPMLFCPACGANLVGKERTTRCIWCGGFMRTTSAIQGDVPCCSERCLRNYLLRNVKTCDQCGMRFTAAGTSGGSFMEMALPGRNNMKYDFCSLGCLVKFVDE